MGNEQVIKTFFYMSTNTSFWDAPGTNYYFVTLLREYWEVLPIVRLEATGVATTVAIWFGFYLAL